MKRKERQNGVAMIMVLTMLVIFAALIVAVVLSSTAAIRRAHAYRDKTTALQIAQAGIQEALHRMNYSYYDTGIYPFGTGNTTEQIPVPGYPSNFFATLSIDTNEETKIISEATYRGRTARVEVNLKGYAHIGDDLRSETGGIPEAFNKHVIYAPTVSIDALATIKGNVTTSTSKPNPWPSNWTGATWTETTLSDLVLFETSVCSFSLDMPPPPAGYDDIYTETGMLINAANPGGKSVNDDPDPAPGVYWDSGNSRYLFGRDNVNLNPEDFNSSSKRILVRAPVEILNTAGNVTIDSYFKTTDTLTINKTITTPTNDTDFCLEVGGGLTIATGISISGDLVVKNQILTLNNNTIGGKVKCDKDIEVTGGSIGGDILSDGSITVNSGTINGNVLSSKDITVGGGTINGSAVCYNTSGSNTIILSGGTINATNSDYDAAVYIHNSGSGSTGTIDISSGSPTITIGENQRAGIAVVAQNGTITIDSPLTLNYASDPPSQFAIVNYTYFTSEVYINASNFNMRGSIYSYKNITLNDTTQTITGILVAGEQLNIGQNSKIIYDPEPYLKNSRVYEGFFWGRRRYVPVPGSWRIVW